MPIDRRGPIDRLAGLAETRCENRSRRPRRLRARCASRPRRANARREERGARGGPRVQQLLRGIAPVTLHRMHPSAFGAEPGEKPASFGIGVPKSFCFRRETSGVGTGG